MNNVHCPMIHGGLQVDLKQGAGIVQRVNHCCLRKEPFDVTKQVPIWEMPEFNKLRVQNRNGEWDDGCRNCQRLEEAGHVSMRQGMLEKFGERYDLSGPLRLDLMFDTNCNLACRICNETSSTFWAKHLKENNLPVALIDTRSKDTAMIEILKGLDLSNLGMVVFSGGETLMGKSYWKVAQTIAELAPNSKRDITLCFQTNGTQPIDKKYYELIEKFHLVKIHISMDGIEDQFEYQRWPAKWNQVVDNILSLRENLPVNVMFLVEETVSVFNLLYSERLANWLTNNFQSNRLGDTIVHSKHLAKRSFSLDALTQEYVDALMPNQRMVLGNHWSENPDAVKTMLTDLETFDKIRGQDWKTVFPELVPLYVRYL